MATIRDEMGHLVFSPWQKGKSGVWQGRLSVETEGIVSKAVDVLCEVLADGADRRSPGFLRGREAKPTHITRLLVIFTFYCDESHDSTNLRRTPGAEPFVPKSYVVAGF